MWRPNGNQSRGGMRVQGGYGNNQNQNRGGANPHGGNHGRGGAQNSNPWPDNSHQSRHGRNGYGESNNKGGEHDPRNQVGMSFRGSGQAVTRPQAPADSASGGLVRPPGPARPGGMPQLRGRGQAPRFANHGFRQPQQLNTTYRYPAEPQHRRRNEMDPNFQAGWYQGKEASASENEAQHHANHFDGPMDNFENNAYSQQQSKYNFNPHQGPVSFGKGGPAPPEPRFAPPISEPPPPPIPKFVEWELRHLQGPLGDKMRKYVSLVSFRKSSEESQRRMWNIELDRHRDIMRAEAEAQALRQKQDFEARNPKKQAGGYATMSDSDRIKNIDWQDLSGLTDKDLNLKLDEMNKLQEKSKKEYLAWKEDCEKWKNQHSNHPNKALFQNYIDQWKEQDKTLMKVQNDQERKINLIRDELYRRDPGPPSPPKFFAMKGAEDFPDDLVKPAMPSEKENYIKKATKFLNREDVVSNDGKIVFERPPGGYGMPRSSFNQTKMVEPKRLSGDNIPIYLPPDKRPPVYEPPKPASLRVAGMDDIPDLPSRKRKSESSDVANLLDLDVNNLKDLLSKVQQTTAKETTPLPPPEDPMNPSGLPANYQLPAPIPANLPSAIPPVRLAAPPGPPPVRISTPPAAQRFPINPNAPPVLHHHPRPPIVHQRPRAPVPFPQKQYRPRLTPKEKNLYERAELARSIPPKQEKKVIDWNSREQEVEREERISRRPAKVVDYSAPEPVPEPPRIIDRDSESSFSYDQYREELRKPKTNVIDYDTRRRRSRSRSRSPSYDRRSRRSRRRSRSRSR